MNSALFYRTCDPDWITVGCSAGGDTLRRHFDYFGSSNYLAETLDACWHPAQLPELNFHSFALLKDRVEVRIFKRQ